MNLSFLHCYQVLDAGPLIIYTDGLTILRNPCVNNFVPDPGLQRKVAEYIRTTLPTPRPTVAQVCKLLPDIMPRWGKVRIAGGGDHIRAKVAQYETRVERDVSFVRVSLNTAVW